MGRWCVWFSLQTMECFVCVCFALSCAAVSRCCAGGLGAGQVGVCVICGGARGGGTRGRRVWWTGFGAWGGAGAGRASLLSAAHVCSPTPRCVFVRDPSPCQPTPRLPICSQLKPKYMPTSWAGGKAGQMPWHEARRLRGVLKQQKHRACPWGYSRAPRVCARVCAGHAHTTPSGLPPHTLAWTGIHKLATVLAGETRAAFVSSTLSPPRVSPWTDRHGVAARRREPFIPFLLSHRTFCARGPGSTTCTTSHMRLSLKSSSIPTPCPHKKINSLPVVPNKNKTKPLASSKRPPPPVVTHTPKKQSCPPPDPPRPTRAVAWAGPCAPPGGGPPRSRG